MTIGFVRSSNKIPIYRTKPDYFTLISRYSKKNEEIKMDKGNTMEETTETREKCLQHKDNKKPFDMKILSQVLVKAWLFSTALVLTDIV